MINMNHVIYLFSHTWLKNTLLDHIATSDLDGKCIIRQLLLSLFYYQTSIRTSPVL